MRIPNTVMNCGAQHEGRPRSYTTSRRPLWRTVSVEHYRSGGGIPCGGKYESTNSGATKSVPLLKNERTTYVWVPNNTHGVCCHYPHKSLKTPNKLRTNYRPHTGEAGDLSNECPGQRGTLHVAPNPDHQFSGARLLRRFAMQSVTPRTARMPRRCCHGLRERGAARRACGADRRHTSPVGSPSPSPRNARSAGGSRARRRDAFARGASVG